MKGDPTVIASDYQVPCRKTIRSRITRRYDTEKDTLTSVMEHVTSATLTTNTWTSNSTEGYISHRASYLRRLGVGDQRPDDACHARTSHVENIATRLQDWTC